MIMKIKPIGKTRYVVNGMLVIADNYKQALTEYLAVHGGSRPMFAVKA